MVSCLVERRREEISGTVTDRRRSGATPLSGLYLTTETTDDLASVARSLVFTPSTESSSCCEDIVAGVVTRVDRPDHWGPAQDPASGVRMVRGGRVALDTSAWAAAADLPFEGGTAAKAILSAWLECGERIAAWLNGAFAIAVLNSGRPLHRFTDRMGSYPVYQATIGSLRLCSHPQVLADALTRAGRQPSLDQRSLAELLATGLSVHPYTYYREIRQLDARTHYLWPLDRPEQEPTRREYWYPAYRDRPPTRAHRRRAQHAPRVRRGMPRCARARWGDCHGQHERTLLPNRS
jgi:hypothetical protein